MSFATKSAAGIVEGVLHGRAVASLCHLERCHEKRSLSSQNKVQKTEEVSEQLPLAGCGAQTSGHATLSQLPGPRGGRRPVALPVTLSIADASRPHTFGPAMDTERQPSHYTTSENSSRRVGADSGVTGEPLADEGRHRSFAVSSSSGPLGSHSALKNNCASLPAFARLARRSASKFGITNENRVMRTGNCSEAHYPNTARAHGLGDNGRPAAVTRAPAESCCKGHLDIECEMPTKTRTELVVEPRRKLRDS
ncbi:hypothetical protein P4O66_017108 [Electrophorus voltai]|uniref:Uncharacterized protein n=1 Tax=Electrophorus voltai TaxID=2609070 RepID=A0AAD8YUJ7_9TELE|nr:hypothetical protein P4O66_017108 [Electrophorus voltai]